MPERPVALPLAISAARHTTWRGTAGRRTSGRGTAGGAVQCQRFFVQGPGSQYFEVRQPEGREEGAEEEEGEEGEEGEKKKGAELKAQIARAAGASGGSKALWSQLRDRVVSTCADVERRAWSTIQPGEADEISPWLERTQWHPYLVGLA